MKSLLPGELTSKQMSVGSQQRKTVESGFNATSDATQSQQLRCIFYTGAALTYVLFPASHH